MLFVVQVRWRGKGPWQDVEECLTPTLAEELAAEYRQEGHFARIRFKSQRPTGHFSTQVSTD